MAASSFFSGNYQKELAKIPVRPRARLPLTNMRWFTVLVGSILSPGSCSSQPSGPEITLLPSVSKSQQSKESVHGIWPVTVFRLDWPPISSVNISLPAVRASRQQKALMNRLGNLRRPGINTVFFQVKPDRIALWKLEILPWSDTLTGIIGQDPGYDPLQFMLDEAHKRGMRVHAWFNPYRVSVDTKPSTVSELNSILSQTPSSVYVLHWDWIRTAGERFVLDPGAPDMRNWITSIVAEVVENYPVDGIQFDDYFYIESPGSAFNSSQTFRRYGQGFASKADWRRDSTQRLTAQVSRTIKKLRPEVEFGVSPAGVWCNRPHDLAGPDTRGATAYDESYADTRRWAQLGLLDYTASQLYWPLTRDAARYDVLAKQWADVTKSTNTRLYIGVALYKVGEPSRREPDWTVKGGVPELREQLDLNESEPYINGTILFREGHFNQLQTQEAVTYVRNRWGC